MIEGQELQTRLIDPICAFHGVRRSKHYCLYCCLCYEDLTPEDCHVLPDGTREDVCNPCAAEEQRHLCTHPWWKDHLMANMETGKCCPPFCGVCGKVQDA